MIFFPSRLRTTAEPKPGRSPSASACAPYLDTIEAGLSRGRNAMAIWQDLVDICGFNAGYHILPKTIKLAKLLGGDVTGQ
jgi:hypothetical protein